MILIEPEWFQTDRWTATRWSRQPHARMEVVLPAMQVPCRGTQTRLICSECLVCSSVLSGTRARHPFFSRPRRRRCKTRCMRSLPVFTAIYRPRTSTTRPTSGRPSSPTARRSQEDQEMDRRWVPPTTALLKDPGGGHRLSVFSVDGFSPPGRCVFVKPSRKPSFWPLLVEVLATRASVCPRPSFSKQKQTATVGLLYR